jgi:small subunit ribosomal protein S6
VTHQYELMVILNPEIDERTVAPSLDKFLKVITNDGGSIDKVDIWGKRRLAYEINRKRDGIYTMVLYQGEGPLVREIERRLRLNEAVMRSLTVLHVPPELTQGVPEDVAAAAEADDE